MGFAHARSRLLLGSALAVTSLFTYGRSAHAACAVTISPTYECSGLNGLTQSILNVTDATVTTFPPFVVNAAAGNGIEISGDGAISFTDVNSSGITGVGNGLQIIGLVGVGPGTVDVYTSGSITGGTHGVSAQNFGLGALTITANGDTTGTGSYGIYALNKNGTDLLITTGIGTTMLGGTVGIRAFNYGSGALEITANGDLTGTSFYGVEANNFSGTDLTVTTAAGTTVTGGKIGILTRNYGSGALEITADGDVTSTSYEAISAFNSANGTDLSVTTGAGTTVTGGEQGINAYNFGTGVLDIIANGDITGMTASGILAHNDAGTDLSVTTAVGTTVIGAKQGINAFNGGTGELVITANGDVTGSGTSSAIAAQNFGTDLTVTTGTGTLVNGGSGIGASNKGTGALEITSNGDVTGTSGSGITAVNYGTDLTVTTGVGTTILGAGGGLYYGIFARNKGSGALEIIANGDITGAGFEGIHAANTAAGTDVTVTTGVGTLISGQRGIYAHNSGSGALEITANGDVISTTWGGIYASNDLTGTDLTVTTGVGSTVLGVAYGIRAINYGSGTFTITIGGGLSTISPTPAFNMDGIAIQTGGTAAATIANQGFIIGRINTGDGNDVFTNDLIWGSSGVSDFSAGTNAMINNGSLVTAITGATAETTTFANAGTFTNFNLMSLSDETAGNGSQTHDTLTVDGDFVGGGLIFMDAYLGGPGSTADLMVVTGNVSGVTQIQVINTSSGGGGTNLDGIALVQVNGTSAAGDFVLADGSISAGLFTYDLQFDAGNSVHELVSTGAAAVSAELATFASAAQSIWYDTLGVLDERFDELHNDIRSATIIDDGTLVQPVSYSPSAKPGLWGKIVGRTTDRNATSSVGGVATDISYGLNTTGLVLGIDGVLEGANGSLTLGVTGGYVNADQDFDSSSAANYEGFTGGFYATYIGGNFRVNGQFKTNVLDLDYTMAGTSGTSDADLISLGAAFEAGYRMDVTDNFYAEPIGQLAYVDSSTHNGDALGTAFSADGDSLRGAIGLSLGGQVNGSGVIFKPELTLKMWGEFEGDNSASFSTFTVADNTPDVFGEASLGVEALSLTNGWSGNLKGDIQFADDFTSFGGFVGLRKSF